MDSRQPFWQSNRKGDSSLTYTTWVDPMEARKKDDLVLYSDDLFLTEARKPPLCPRSHTFHKSKGEAYSSISSSRRSVRFYEASKHSSLALINQELCRNSLRLPIKHPAAPRQ
ncbi:hypothetical protein PIB30_078584 [Stylosanthes scabra]|uniref:Uncharacterized protein n=1 Tax=Stylosanthes scabra TaxID=79078 RepID=A0ABU6XR16_9FABA|nr:hypothetical protein [Stylosanthes scabra]